MSILVVDDHEDYDIFCDAIKAVDREADCLHLADGRAAIDYLTKGIIIFPDYIFLDVNMPIMGGKECLSKIMSNHILKGIPVIIYSTTSNPDEMFEFTKLGAKDFIVKPACFETLVWILKEVFKNRPISKNA